VALSCAFCDRPVNPYDLGAHSEYTVWVTGPKKDHAKLRRSTGRVACRVCIQKMEAGQPPDQLDLFEQMEDGE
jgi:hypothetical protein